jgi:hypothetical protein
MNFFIMLPVSSLEFYKLRACIASDVFLLFPMVLCCSVLLLCSQGMSAVTSSDANCSSRTGQDTTNVKIRTTMTQRLTQQLCLFSGLDFGRDGTACLPPSPLPPESRSEPVLDWG